MSASRQVNWSPEDQELQQEFAEVINLVEDHDEETAVPRKLDRQIKQIAHGSALNEIEQSWVFSSGARLTLAVLVFFAIAMLWLSL
jgi:hypothetical protein